MLEFNIVEDILAFAVGGQAVGSDHYEEVV